MRRVVWTLLLVAPAAGCFLSHGDDGAGGSTGGTGGQSAGAGGRPDGPGGGAGDGCAATVDVTINPVARAQIAIWLESDDGARMETLLLTEAVGLRGIGNRPGAAQMNSGYRWPYGRRTDVLPHWATRRLQNGGQPFRTVVYQDRPEGYAGRISNDQSPEPYFCAAFDPELSRLGGLDAVSCASRMLSDKGRYLRDNEAGYAQPAQVEGMGLMSPLTIGSAYPPRRDVQRCVTEQCFDHADVGDFEPDALATMPSLDAVTSATLAPEPATLSFEVDPGWLAEPASLFVEVHTEGDYNERSNPDIFPTPVLPEGAWDSWAQNYGYPYRGQPSVVFTVALAEGAVQTALDPSAYTTTVDGPLGPIEGGMISNDPLGAPGSGADRLRPDGDGVRVSATAFVPCER